jgi:hypothetical protein
VAHFGLADKLFERVDRLSGGERQRVALARLVASQARLFLVDEPLSALDPTRGQQAMQALTALARERQATLVTSLHHVDIALQHFPRIVGLRGGRIAFDLPTEQVTAEVLRTLYAQHLHGDRCSAELIGSVRHGRSGGHALSLTGAGSWNPGHRMALQRLPRSPATDLSTVALRDPAWHQRLGWAVVGVILLWPMLVITEFKPWVLVEPGALGPTLRFLSDFLPPKLDLAFLAMVAVETWRTVAIATAGLVLAAVWQCHGPVVGTHIEAFWGMAAGRAPVGAVDLVLLRSVPDWSGRWCLSSRGLGPTAGVLAIALTYGGSGQGLPKYRTAADTRA